MDNSLSGRRGPARQTPEKDVLCLHRLRRPSTVHSPGGVSYFLPVQTEWRHGIFFVWREICASEFFQCLEICEILC